MISTNKYGAPSPGIQSTPERLQAAAAPIEERRRIEARRASIAAELAEIAAARNRAEHQAINLSLPQIANGQAELYRSGFAPGMAERERAALDQAVYHPAPEAAAAEGVKTPAIRPSPTPEGAAVAHSGPQSVAHLASADEVRAAPPGSAEHFVFDKRTGERFVKGEDGTAQLGVVPAFAGALHDEGELPIQLRRADIKHVDTPAKQAEARELGYRDGLDLTRDVAAHWADVYPGHSGRLLLAIPNGQAKVAVVELGREGGSYRIVTAGLRDRGNLPGEPLWQKGREPSEASAGATPPASRGTPAEPGEAPNSASGQSGAENMAPIHPEDKAEIAAAERAGAEAEQKAAAYGEAAVCLKGAS